MPSWIDWVTVSTAPSIVAKLQVAAHPRLEQADTVPLPFGSARMLGSQRQPDEGDAKFLAHFAGDGGGGFLERPHPAAGQQIQVGPPVGIADQQQLTGVVEQHHLDPASARAKRAPHHFLRRIGKVEEATGGRHRATIAQGAGSWPCGPVRVGHADKEGKWRARNDSNVRPSDS